MPPSGPSTGTDALNAVSDDVPISKPVEAAPSSLSTRPSLGSEGGASGRPADASSIPSSSGDAAAEAPDSASVSADEPAGNSSYFGMV